MKMKFGVLLVALMSVMLWGQLWAQEAPAPGPGGPGGPGMHGPHGPHGDFAWWKNSETTTKLGLNDSQVKQLDQTFVQHKMKLIDDMAAMQKADLTLHSLLDADSPDQSQVMAAVDQVLASRGTVERETTMMMLDMRKVLTVEQWKQLRAMHPMGPGFGRGGPEAMHRNRMRGKSGTGSGAPGGAPPDGGPPQQD